MDGSIRVFPKIIHSSQRMKIHSVHTIKYLIVSDFYSNSPERVRSSRNLLRHSCTLDSDSVCHTQKLSAIKTQTTPLCSRLLILILDVHPFHYTYLQEINKQLSVSVSCYYYYFSYSRDGTIDH